MFHIQTQMLPQWTGQAASAMKLAYAMLADAADVGAGDKLNIIGGDFDTIEAPSFPAVQPKLALVAKLHFETSDFAQADALPRDSSTGNLLHEFRIQCFEPDGETLVFAGVVAINLASIPTMPGLMPRFLVTANFPPLVFRVEGIYTWHLFWDGEQLGTLSVQVKEPAHPDADHASDVEVSHGAR